jgi:hypothetical protein
LSCNDRNIPCIVVSSPGKPCRAVVFSCSMPYSIISGGIYPSEKLRTERKLAKSQSANHPAQRLQSRQSISRTLEDSGSFIGSCGDPGFRFKDIEWNFMPRPLLGESPLENPHGTRKQRLCREHGGSPFPLCSPRSPRSPGTRRVVYQPVVLQHKHILQGF